MRSLLRAVPAFVLVAGAMAAQAPAWTSFSSTDCKFKVLMPAKPKASQRTDEDGGRKFVTKFFAAQTATVSCVASCTFLPSGTTEEVVKNMKAGIVAGLINRVNGHQQSKEALKLAGIPGSKLVFTGDGAEGSIWMGVTGGRLYVLTIGMKDHRDAKAEAKFLGSFSLLK